MAILGPFELPPLPSGHLTKVADYVATHLPNDCQFLYSITRPVLAPMLGELETSPRGQLASIMIVGGIRFLADRLQQDQMQREAMERYEQEQERGRQAQSQAQGQDPVGSPYTTNGAQTSGSRQWANSSTQSQQADMGRNGGGVRTEPGRPRPGPGPGVGFRTTTYRDRDKDRGRW